MSYVKDLEDAKKYLQASACAMLLRDKGAGGRQISGLWNKKYEGRRCKY